MKRRAEVRAYERVLHHRLGDDLQDGKNSIKITRGRRPPFDEFPHNDIPKTGANDRGENGESSDCQGAQGV